ncbi:alginate export family protein [uncultured Croceitalea sp.]|uniref:alginate export family protein n=1 Tax=uncultured Croceitalea sp. TaxID=1798908 RepID=UPI00330685D3
MMASVYAQEKRGSGQPIIPVRFLENYEYLKDTSQISNALDHLKFIPINDSKTSYLSIGGELKTFYESIKNREDEGEAYLLTRLMVHADIHLGNRLRVFVQPASGFESFREAPPRVIDRDELFLLNAFVDFKILNTEKNTLTTRIGRQELNYGRGRLVTIREGPNVRHYWEGASLLYNTKKWKADAFFTKYGTNDFGVFDNPILDSDETFWGTYWQSKNSMLFDAKLDMYYLGFIDNTSQFFNANGKETRHTIGGRLYKKNNHWDFDIEAAGQFGSIGNSNISAFGFFGEVGYTLDPEAIILKRIGLKADYFTGDQDANDTKVNTFNPMYPRQGYYRGAGALYAANFFDVHPSFIIEKKNDFSFLVDWSWYWRTSTEDGLYIGGSGIPLLAPNGSDKSYLGSQLNFQFIYTINRYVNTTINYSHFYSGGFIKDNPTPMEISDFMNLALQLRF